MNQNEGVLPRTMKRLAGFIYDRCRLVIGVSFVFLVLCVYLSATRLGVLNDTNALIRQDSPVMSYWLNYLKEFKTSDPMVVVIKSDSFENNRHAMDELAEKIKDSGFSSNEIVDVYYRNDLHRLKPHFLLFQSPEELQTTLMQIRTQREMLGKSGGHTDLNTLLDGAIAQFNKVDKERGGHGSLDELESYADKMVSNLETLARDLDKPVSATDQSGAPAMDSEIAMFEREVAHNQYLSFLDGKLLLMQIMPGKGDSNSFSPHEKTIARLRTLVMEVRKNHPEVRIGLTGEPVLMDDELQQSTHDSIVAFSIAFLLIAVLFFFSYHELGRPALALYALVHAIFWSLGFTVLSVHHLNIISQAFVLMLLGLGIDFSIQFVGRYEEERARGADVRTALENAMQYTGVAIVTGGATAAAAFFTMCFNDFLGLTELGLIAGMGMIFCLLASLVLYPALIAWADTRSKKAFSLKHALYSERGRKFDELLQSRPGPVLVLLAVITLFLGWQGSRVRFDYNLLNLQSPDLESVRLAREMVETPDLPFISGVIVADDMNDAARMTAQLEALPTVAGVNSPTKILPEKQTEKLLVLAQVRTELNNLKLSAQPGHGVDVARARVSLQTILGYCRQGQKEAEKMRQVRDKRIGQALRIFDRLIPALQKSVDQISRLSATEAEGRLNHYQNDLIAGMQRQFEFLKGFDMEKPVTLEDLPPQALQHFISPGGKILLEIIPKENIFEREANERFVADVRKVNPKVTGTPVQNYTYIDVLKESYQQAAWYALIAIVIMVGLHFRHWQSVMLALFPLGIGMVWTVGLMKLFGWKFNPANIITLPLVIGIGVAYGVYVVDRHREAAQFSLFGSSTGKAILLSACTAVIGFGAMTLGNYPGLVSLGEVMSLGIVCCFAASTVVLPQILRLLDERKQR